MASCLECGKKLRDCMCPGLGMTAQEARDRALREVVEWLRAKAQTRHLMEPESVAASLADAIEQGEFDRWLEGQKK